MSKTARKMARVKERGGGGEEMEELPLSFLPLPLPPLSFFGFRSVSLSHFSIPESTEGRRNAHDFISELKFGFSFPSLFSLLE